MLLQFTHRQLDCILDEFEFDPKKATDYLTVLVCGLQDSEHGDRLKNQLCLKEDLLLLLEHCLMQILVIDKRWFANGLYQSTDPVSGSMYILKLLEFLHIMAFHDDDLRSKLFHTGMLNKSVIFHCVGQTGVCPYTATSYVKLMQLYLCTNPGWEEWFTSEENVRHMKEVAETFCKVAVLGHYEEETTRIFLDTVAQSDFGPHDSMMINTVFKRYILLAWERIERRVRYLEFQPTKTALDEYVAVAQEASKGFDYRMKARAMVMVHDVLSREEAREKTEIPAVRRLLLAALLYGDEVEENRGNALIQAILPKNEPEVFSPFEKSMGHGSLRHVKEWGTWELRGSHAVYEYMNYVGLKMPKGYDESALAMIEESVLGVDERGASKGGDNITNDVGDTNRNSRSMERLILHYREKLDEHFLLLLPHLHGSFDGISRIMLVDTDESGLEI